MMWWATDPHWMTRVLPSNAAGGAEGAAAVARVAPHFDHCCGFCLDCFPLVV